MRADPADASAFVSPNTVRFAAGENQHTALLTLTTSAGEPAANPAGDAFQVTATDAGDSLDQSSAAGTLPVFNPQSIVWQNVQRVTVQPDSSLLAPTVGAWTSGASSAQVLQGGAGYVQFTASGPLAYRAIGFAHGTPTHSYAGLDYGLDLTSNGEVTVYESGVYRGAVGYYSSGDNFRIGVQGGMVSYSQQKGGAGPWTSLRSVPSASLAYPLSVDTSSFSRGAALANVQVGGGWA